MTLCAVGTIGIIIACVGFIMLAVHIPHFENRDYKPFYVNDNDFAQLSDKDTKPSHLYDTTCDIEGNFFQSWSSSDSSKGLNHVVLVNNCDGVPNTHNCVWASVTQNEFSGKINTTITTDWSPTQVDNQSQEWASLYPIKSHHHFLLYYFSCFDASPVWYLKLVQGEISYDSETRQMGWISIAITISGCGLLLISSLIYIVKKYCSKHQLQHQVYLKEPLQIKTET